jgi:tetratricopeptide (TPR) repeat protein/predicted Ser/Thr protein kinase
MLDKSREETCPSELATLAASSRDRSPAELAVLLRADLEARWGAGDCLPVEAYLGWFPSVAKSAQDALCLIVAEIQLRATHGERPCCAEYQARLPEYREQLRGAFAVWTLGTTSTSPPSAFGATPSVTGAADPVDPPAVPGYTVLEELGRGGMGIVYLAEQNALRRRVALKVIRGEASGTDERIRFRAEAEAAARLAHPHIVSIYEVGESLGRPYFSMEYCPGGSLAKRLKENPLVAREAAQLVEMLARATQAAHEAKVIHRDLKPSNVLLSADGAPKISDFGLAKKLDDASLTQSGAILGTPSYMAPEQARGQGKDVGPPADLYALGAILYECLTARPPFKATTAMETLMQVQTEEPPAPRALQPGVPRDVETITLKCLSKLPAQRYASAADLAADLRRFVAGQPIAARPVGVAGRLIRWVKRRPAAAVAAAVSILALVTLTTGLAIALVVVRRERDSTQAERNNALAARARTRAALDEVSSEAIETLLAQQRTLSDRHKAFLRRTLELYGEFIEDRDVGPETRAEVAQAHLRMSIIRTTLGELNEAQVALDRGIEILTALTAEHAEEPTYQAQLAKALDERGLLLYRLGQRTQAEDCFQQASEQFAVLARDYPQNTTYRINHANCQVNWANALADRRQRPQAEAKYRNAIQLLGSLPPETASQPATRTRLAMAHYNLALLLNEMGRDPEAETEYGQSIAINEKLAKELPDSHEYARRLSSSLINLSELVGQRGAREEAEKLLRRGLEIQEKLTRDYPSIPEYRKYLGRTLRSLASLLHHRQKLPEAAEAYRRTVEVQDQLVSQYPRIAEYQRDLASTFNNRGFFEMETGRLREAEKSFRKAQAIQEPLVLAHGTILEYRQELCNTYGNLGEVLLRLREFAQAEMEYRHGLEHEQTLWQRFPDDPEYQLRVGAAEGNVAEILAEQGKKEESLKWFDRALGNLKSALEKEKPPSARGQGWLRNTLQGRATTLQQLGRFTVALADWNELVRLAPKAEEPTLRLLRALCLVQAGQVEQGVAEAHALSIDPQTSGERLRIAARVLARAVEGGPPSRKEEYAQKALDRLRRVEAKGLFKSRDEVDRLDKDPDLASLRGRPGFQSWRAQLPLPKESR